MNKLIQSIRLFTIVIAAFTILPQGTLHVYAQKVFFPLPGQGLDKQSRKTTAEVGLNPVIAKQLNEVAPICALWKDGHLVHVNGDWNRTRGVASLRKTIHAVITGAALNQGRIKSLQLKIGDYLSLPGNDADATIAQVLSRTSSIGVPEGPGETWDYRDREVIANIALNCKVYGKTTETYDDVLRTAFADAIGMQGWRSKLENDDKRHVHFNFDVEDMGRIGLLLMARGRWNGVQLIPQQFVEQLETKQTYGLKCPPNDKDKPGCSGPKHEPAYGYMTWVNTDRDVYPKASKEWAWGAGSGGHRIFWNHRLGIVYAELNSGYEGAIPEIIEANLSTGPTPASTSSYAIN
jgi:CubicO group peptidase (beta-lactamase class C family)